MYEHLSFSCREAAIRRAEYGGTRSQSKKNGERPTREARLECVHSFSRVWRNKERSGSPRSFARHSEKAGSQPKKKSLLCTALPPTTGFRPVATGEVHQVGPHPPFAVRRRTPRDANGRGEPHPTHPAGSRKGVSYDRYFLSYAASRLARSRKKNGSFVIRAMSGTLDGERERERESRLLHFHSKDALKVKGIQIIDQILSSSLVRLAQLF